MISVNASSAAIRASERNTRSRVRAGSSSTADLVASLAAIVATISDRKALSGI